jgi:hypothetical protein
MKDLSIVNRNYVSKMQDETPVVVNVELVFLIFYTNNFFSSPSMQVENGWQQSNKDKLRRTISSFLRLNFGKRLASTTMESTLLLTYPMETLPSRAYQASN